MKPASAETTTDARLRAANSPRDIFTFAALVLALNQSAIKKDVHKLGLPPQLLGTLVLHQSKKVQQRKLIKPPKLLNQSNQKHVFVKVVSTIWGDGSCAPFVFLVKDRTLPEGQFVPIKLNGIGASRSLKEHSHFLHLGLQQLEDSVT